MFLKQTISQPHRYSVERPLSGHTAFKEGSEGDETDEKTDESGCTRCGSRCFFFFLTGYMNCLQASLQGSQGNSAFIFGDAGPYAAKTRLSFEGGHAVLGLYDTPAALELSERQPLVVPLQHKDGRIVLPDMPPVVLSDADKTEMTPKIGDIAFDTTTQELVIFCQPEDTVSTLIPVGRVLGGMNYLLQTDGEFAGYLMSE